MLVSNLILHSGCFFFCLVFKVQLSICTIPLRELDCPSSTLPWKPLDNNGITTYKPDSVTNIHGLTHTQRSVFCKWQEVSLIESLTCSGPSQSVESRCHCLIHGAQKEVLPIFPLNLHEWGLTVFAFSCHNFLARDVHWPQYGLLWSCVWFWNVLISPDLC